MPLLEISKRQERDKTRMSVILEGYGAMENGLTQSNFIAGVNQREQKRARVSNRELERAREEIWSYLDKLVTELLTD